MTDSVHLIMRGNPNADYDPVYVIPTDDREEALRLAQEAGYPIQDGPNAMYVLQRVAVIGRL